MNLLLSKHLTRKMKGCYLALKKANLAAIGDRGFILACGDLFPVFA